MRILHICAYAWSIGGPPKVIYDLTDVALAEGHSVDILSPVSPGETLYPVPTGARLITFPRQAFISRFFREFSVGLYQFLRRHQAEYDIVHCHGLWHWGALAPFLVSGRAKRVVTVHGLLDPWVYARSRWKKRLIDVLAQRAFLRRANVIHVFNPDEQADVQRYLGNVATGPPAANIVQIPNGIRPDDFTSLPAHTTFRQSLKLPLDKKLVLFMSRLSEKKGLDLLIPAFAQYITQHDDAVLILAGADDGYEATTRQLIAQHHLDAHVRLVGLLTGEQKKAALADADVFALTSYSEGFSMACLEALAAGVPALLSDRVGFADALRQHDAAELIDLNVTDVARGLTALLQNPARRQALAKRGPALVRAEYDIQRTARRMLAAYAQALRSQ